MVIDETCLVMLSTIGYCGIALCSIIFSVLPVSILDDPDNKTLAASTDSLLQSQQKLE